MLNKIVIKNFKCFDRNTPQIKLKNFNVICGPNSSGKSTINQAILIHLQNNKFKKESFISNGKFVHFDEFAEIKNSATSSEKDIQIELINDENKTCKMILSADSDGKTIMCKELLSQFDLIEEENIFYISASRIGPEDVYNKLTNNLIEQFGQNAIGFLAKYQNETINEKYAYVNSPTKDYKFIKEVNYWLQEIIGEQINVSELSRTDRSTATYSREVNSLEVRNKNTGSGLSYIITILVSVLSVSIKNLNEKPLFIIENPEIHLHPTAQISLMKFLIHMSQFCQIIVETHSDYIIKKSLQCSNGQVIKLNKDFKPIYYNKRSKYTLKTLSLGEIQWTAFDLPTIDFHINLFSYLQQKYEEFALNELDDKLRKTQSFKNKRSMIDTRCKRFLSNGKNSKNPESIFETLPVYLRNVIDHPVRRKGGNEPPRKKYRETEETFNNALKTSIEFMIEVIKENNW